MQDKKNERSFYEKMFSGVKDAIGDGYCITYGYDDIYTLTVDKVQKGTVLDVACGGGKHAINLAKRGFKVVAIELTTEGIRVAREAAKSEGVKVQFIQGDVENMPFKDGVFDYSFCGLIFHHFVNMKRFMDDVARVTKKNIFGIEPNACEPVTNLLFNFLNPCIGVSTLTKNQRAIYPRLFQRLFQERGFNKVQFYYLDIHHRKQGFLGNILKIYRKVTFFLPDKFKSNKFAFEARRDIS